MHADSRASIVKHLVPTDSNGLVLGILRILLCIKLKSKGAQAVLSETTSTGCIECECKLQANSYPSNCTAPATVSITHLEAHQWVLPSALPLDLLISKQESHQYCSQ